MNYISIIFIILFYCLFVDSFDDESNGDDAEFRDAYEFDVLLDQNQLSPNTNAKPFLITLSIGIEPNQLFISWSSMRKLSEPIALFGESTLTTNVLSQEFPATDQRYSLHNNQYQSQLIYRATINNFEAGKQYFYKVGEKNGEQSETLRIVSKPNSSNDIVTTKRGYE
jgi:hypothetical protein